MTARDAATEIGILINRMLALAPEAGLRIGIKIEPASADTHPQSGDSAQTEAPFMSGAVSSEETADAQHPLARMVELDEEIEADHPGWMAGETPTGDDNV